jgi:hypothetical protein
VFARESDEGIGSRHGDGWFIRGTIVFFVLGHVFIGFVNATLCLGLAAS